MANQVTSYLKYANVQMAAEALFVPQSASPGTTYSGAITSDVLTTGNTRSSKFPDVLAAQFSQDWTVVEHISSTTTGFSGTLFRCTRDDPSRGLVAGELVMSFRSTEFADDAARDNQATNTLEVSKFGWAFGQISDMRKWVDSLYLKGAIPAGAALNVTGYSLGGHLATTFNLLYPDAVASTHTFNGAGVGVVHTGSLVQAIDLFEQSRTRGNADIFTTTATRQMYLSLQPVINGSASTARMAQALQDIDNAMQATSNATAKEEYKLLRDAVSRADTVLREALRIPSVVNSSAPQVVEPKEIAAIQLDYQLGVLQAARRTSGYRTSVPLGGWDAAFGRNPAPGGAIANFYDVYGANPPSAVANSQYHYGTPAPVFIEDQPLFRGSALLDALIESASNAELKLLVDNFSQNDFGDTHSLVLLVDSLSVQDVLSKLDPQVEQGTLDQILKAASDAKTQTTLGGQGKAEGDVLENVLDALRRTLMGPSASPTPARMTGGTWANIDDRNVFHNNLKALTDSTAFKSLSGKVRVNASTFDLGAQAREKFSVLASLMTLSPVILTGTDAASQSMLDTVLQGAWGAAYTAWQADKDMSSERRFAEATYSDTWITDRAALLSALMRRNVDNTSDPFVSDPTAPRDRSYEFMSYSGRPREGETQPTLQTLLVNLSGGSKPAQRIAFGDDGNNVFVGTDGVLGDHLYGGKGDDRLTGLKGSDWLEGGAGTDTYSFAANWGADIIRDSDGLGAISVEGLGPIDGAGAKKVAEGVWQTADKKVNYTLVAIDAQRNDLGLRGDDLLLGDEHDGELHGRGGNGTLYGKGRDRLYFHCVVRLRETVAANASVFNVRSVA